MRPGDVRRGPERCGRSQTPAAGVNARPTVQGKGEAIRGGVAVARPDRAACMPPLRMAGVFATKPGEGANGNNGGVKTPPYARGLFYVVAIPGRAAAGGSGGGKAGNKTGTRIYFSPSLDFPARPCYTYPKMTKGVGRCARFPASDLLGKRAALAVPGAPAGTCVSPHPCHGRAASCCGGPPSFAPGCRKDLSCSSYFFARSGARRGAPWL